jgi:hypothetical protein
MSQMSIISARLRGGIWEGRVGPSPAATLPALQARHLDRVLEGLTLARADDGESVSFRLPLPMSVLSDGVQTVVLLDETGQVLGSLALYAGNLLEPDIRAEVDLLRAELDMLKRAFRRHCVETGADR